MQKPGRDQPKWHFNLTPDIGVGVCGMKAKRFITNVDTFMAEPPENVCGNCRRWIESHRVPVYESTVPRGGR